MPVNNGIMPDTCQSGVEIFKKREHIRANQNLRKFLTKLFHFTKKKHEAFKGVMNCLRPYKFLVVKPE